MPSVINQGVARSACGNWYTWAHLAKAKVSRGVGPPFAAAGKERSMKSAEICLRSVVEKWFATAPVRVTRFKWSGIVHSRSVRVEARASSKVFSIVFFKHEDGAWRVFPPDGRRPAMRFYMNAELPKS